MLPLPSHWSLLAAPAPLLALSFVSTVRAGSHLLVLLLLFVLVGAAMGIALLFNFDTGEESWGKEGKGGSDRGSM